jgi:hypothetical protein
VGDTKGQVDGNSTILGVLNEKRGIIFEIYNSTILGKLFLKVQLNFNIAQRA